ncbi:hypothetical protein IJG78_04005 [Candidatus Saccharibacteria bacterium]|nr:hypothetical protein [Candidatus Saccharibacteria bacterium]
MSEIPEEFLELLPKDFEKNLVTPEVKTFYLDREAEVGVIEIVGDVSHFNRVDNPIVEVFRTVEQHVRKGDTKALTFTAGCPHYDSATNLTICRFYPNNVKKWNARRLAIKTEQILLHRIGPLLKKLLRAYFAAEENSFKEYQIYLSLLATTGDNKDKIDWLRDACNNSIKEFIMAQGYELPARRLVLSDTRNFDNVATKANYNMSFISDAEKQEVDILRKLLAY